jgi:site-specific DNA-cytosine methylase
MEAAALGWHNIASCENNRYARQLLQLRFGHDILPDANTADATAYRDIADVITFSPPCQPNSTAGKRLGADDPRNGLPVCLRILEQAKPAWAVIENVPGLATVGDGLVLRQFLRSLENLRYHPVVLRIPSAAVGAIHLRYRLWVVAHAHQKRRPAGTIPPKPAQQKTWRDVESDNLAHAARLAATSKAALVGIYHGLPAGLDRHRAKQISLMGNAADPRIIRRILTSIDHAIRTERPQN